MRLLASRHATEAPAWITWPLVAALLALITGSISASMLSDPDTLWHIAVGRWIVEHRQLPLQDMFSWSSPGIAWTAHEWLSELIFFWTWSVAGFPGIVALVSLSFALTAAIVVRFFCDRLDPLHVLPVSLVFVSIISTHLLARPHALVWPLMALWIALLVVAVDRHQLPPWWSLGVLLLWANLHASFTLGLGMAGGLALDAIVSESSNAARRRMLGRWAAFGLGCVVAVSINPNGLGTLLHAVHMMQMKEMLALIDEWKSADFHQFQLVLLWIVLVVGLGLLGRLRLSPVRAVLVLGVLYMALKHGRYHSTLALASAFLLAEPIGSGLRSLRSGTEPVEAHGMDRLMQRLAAPSHRMAVLVTMLLALSWTVAARDMMGNAPPERVAPAKAVAALQAAGGADRVMNSYGFGGYLIFRGIPVYVDGRADMYGDPFMRGLADAFRMKSAHSLEQYFDAHQVRWTMLATSSPAVELLDHLPGWRRVYSDSIATIHTRPALGITPR